MKQILIKGWFDVSCSGEASYKDIERLQEGSIIKLNFANCTSSCDASLLHSEYMAETKEIVYGEARTGIDRTLQLALHFMQDGETAHVKICIERKYIHADLTDIEDVEFSCDITLSVVQKTKEIFRMDDMEKFDRAKALKDKGTSILTSKEYCYSRLDMKLSAFALLNKAVRYLSMVECRAYEVEQKDCDLLYLQCLNNLVFLQLSLNNNEKAVKLATRIISKDPHNVKAIYRRAVANLNLQNFELTQADLEKVLELDPKNKSAQNQFNILRTKQKALDSVYAMAMKKFIFS